MAKRKEKEEVKTFDILKYDQHLKEQKIDEMLDVNYMPYAMSVIISRALPDVRDGLKPSQRKVLYTMKNLGLKPGNKSKSANINGSCLRFNPHSDMSCYETMVRMVDKNETLLAPYVEGKGSFGKHYSRDMAFAAARYCVTGDTYIVTSKGIVSIESLKKYCTENNSLDIKIKSLEFSSPANKFIDSGIQPIRRITLSNGQFIDCTPNHPLMMVDSYGDLEWKLACDIEIGDICIVDMSSNFDDFESKEIKNKLFIDLNNFYNKLLLKGYLYTTTFLDENELMYYFTLLSFFGIETEIDSKNLTISLERFYYETLRQIIYDKKVYNSYNRKRLSVISNEEKDTAHVYSVHVDDDLHAFSANGFINHNTEASLSKLGMKLFDGINENAIDMVDNYDGTLKEPSVLPVAFPAILANPTLGIAVGFASSICSFNLKELCEATIQHIKHPKDNLLDIMPAPDFTTGGEILYNETEMKQIYETGRGQVRIRSKYTIFKKENKIEITEIPFSTSAEAIVEKIIDLCKTGQVTEINDIRDDTDKNGLLITIEYKRTCDPEKLMNKLFKLTTLEDVFSCNFNVIVNNNPKCLGVYNILDEWIKFRKECIIRTLTFELDNFSRLLHLLRGLEKILVNIDKAIKIIKNTEKDDEVVPNLMKGFKIDEVQAQYIADIKLRNINKQYILERTSEISKLEAEIEKLKKQIASDAEIKKIIISDLQEIISKYSIPRKSIILKDYVETTFTAEPEDLVDELSIIITKDGCIKKVNRLTIEEKNEKFKNPDVLFCEDIYNNEDLLVFTDKGNVYKYKVSLLKKETDKGIGAYLNSLCEFEEDEKFIFIHPTNNYSKNLLIVFEDGKAVTIPIKAYETKTNRKVLINGFSTHAKAIFMAIVNEEKNKDLKKFLIKFSNDKSLAFMAKNVTFKTTRSSMGAQIARLNKNVTIISCIDVTNVPEDKIKKFFSDVYPSSGKNSELPITKVTGFC